MNLGSGCLYAPDSKTDFDSDTDSDYCFSFYSERAGFGYSCFNWVGRAYFV